MEVRFEIQGGDPVRIPCQPGENLLELMRRAGIAVDAPCSGNGTCGKCRVRLLEGALDSPPSHHISPEEYAQGWRLSCASRIMGECTVLLPTTDLQNGIQTAELMLPEENGFSRDDGDGVGCAIDIGTTTVAAVLTDLKTGSILAKGSMGNAQIAYGADVIQRIIEQSRPGGILKMRGAILDDTLLPLMDELCQSAGISCDDISKIAIAANTTMNHLLLGVNADSIRKEPYMPVFLSKKGLCAGALGLKADPAAQVLLAPNVASYVGGDITAGVLSSGLWRQEGVSLLIDLGTNGELVLGGKDFLLCCACSAGPALEGGGISCGMRATHGAIEACVIGEGQKPVLSVIGGGKPAGICGSGIIDAVAQLFSHGLIDAQGKFSKDAPRVKRDVYGMGRYVLANREESANGQEISVTEADIDNFIRTKAAIYAAIHILLESVDMTAAEVDRVYVAGGIGSGIRLQSAVQVGMFPAAFREKFHYLGNTALAGAYAMTVSEEAADKVEKLAAGMTYLELSDYPGYMDAFVAACFLPHTDKSRFALD